MDTGASLQRGPAFSARRRRKRRSAFTLFEVLLAVTVLLIMAVMFAAVVPVATRGTHMSRSYSQAVLIAQRKIDQMQGAGFNQLSGATLSDALRIVDAGGAPTMPGGDTFEFTSRDQLTAVLGPRARGYIRIRPWCSAAILNQNSLLSAEVILEWYEKGTGSKTTYRISTLITKMPMNNQ